MVETLLPLVPFVPTEGSPALVRVFDKIRFGPLGENDELGEFLWFAREYPRVYRHHVDHAEYRLDLIQQALAGFHADARERFHRAGAIAEEVRMVRPGALQMDTYSIYWNFESYLSATSSALDILARIAGTAYKGDTAHNFNRFCKSAPADPLAAILRRAQARWVRRLKAYRDCFVHYTPVDTLLLVALARRKDGWQIRARLPANPEAREILSFRYSNRVELWGYALQSWRHFQRLDRQVANVIGRLYRTKQFPKKTARLFVLGRSRSAEHD